MAEEWRSASDNDSKDAQDGCLAVVVNQQGDETFALAVWRPHSERWALCYVRDWFGECVGDTLKVVRWRPLPDEELNCR